MAKQPDDKQPPQQKKPTPINHAPDHLAAGAADLRTRAKACRITAGNVRACRRLDAAADLLDPETDGAEGAPGPSAAQEGAPEGRKGGVAGKKAGKARRAAAGAVSGAGETETTPAPALADDDLDVDPGDEEA